MAAFPPKRKRERRKEGKERERERGEYILWCCDVSDQ
jgi:hypothetical protein